MDFGYFLINAYDQHQSTSGTKIDCCTMSAKGKIALF
jgi:hypothetical protein